jgi:hypothetical protein
MELAQVGGCVGDSARTGSSLPASSGSCDKPRQRRLAFRSEMRYGGEASSGTGMAAHASRDPGRRRRRRRWVREACTELAVATGGRACEPGSGAGVQGEGKSLSGRVVI